jgi:hypothetical protein
MELIAGIQLSHQSVVFRRAALSALLFGMVGHVFLLYVGISVIFLRCEDAGYAQTG